MNMTRWYRPSEKVPKNNEQVLVRHGDQIDLATYDAEKEVLRLDNGTTFAKDADIMWMGLITGTPA